MTDKQILRLLKTSVEFSTTLEEARAYTDFILNGADKTDSPDNIIKPAPADGVYIIYSDDSYQKYVHDRAYDYMNAKAIGIKFRGNSFGVTLADLPDEAALVDNPTSECEESSPFYMPSAVAVHHFDGDSATKHLRCQYYLDISSGQYIPTLGQLCVMYIYKDILHRALDIVQGEPLKEDCYWSSSEADQSYSYFVRFSDGAISSGNKSVIRWIRPCIPFNL